MTLPPGTPQPILSAALASFLTHTLSLRHTAQVINLLFIGCTLFFPSTVLIHAATPTSPPAQGPKPSASEWPMFRGEPSLSGNAPGKLQLPLSLLWSTKTGGPVKSSAAISQNKVLVGSHDQHLHALSATDGKSLWKFKTQGPIESSPLILQNRVYFGSEDGMAYCLKLEDGSLLWKFQTDDKILGSPNYVIPDPAHPENIQVLFGSYDFKLYCLDAATGKSNWVYESSNYINGTPAADGGRTVFGGCDALMHVISLKNGTQIKEFSAGAYIAGSACLLGKHAFVGHYENEFLCFDLEKGTNIWSYRDRNFPYFSSPAVTEDRVVFGGRDKRLHCVNRSNGEPVWQFNTGGKVDSSPVVVDSKVVVGSDDGFFYVVDLKSGKSLWSYEIGQPVGASAAIIENLVVIGSDDGTVYAFTHKEGKRP